MKTIEPRRDVLVIGDKSLDALEAEWRAWTPPSAHKPDAIPPGWISVADYMRIARVCREASRRRLTKGVKSGEIETRKFRLLVRGALVPIRHFRFKARS